MSLIESPGTNGQIMRPNIQKSSMNTVLFVNATISFLNPFLVKNAIIPVFSFKQPINDQNDKSVAVQILVLVYIYIYVCSNKVK